MADFMPHATIQQELESRVTQMQEGEDDVDIPAMDTTIPMGQQAYMTRDRAYMLNPQVNLSLAVRTYCSQNCMLLNYNGEHIRCKPISPCKLWKLQSGSSDQHPRGIGDWVILQSGPALGLDNHTFANPSSHLSASLPLDVDLMTQIEVFIVCMKRLVCT